MLFTQFFEFVCYELYFCTDNYLYGCFSRTDHSGNSGRLDLLLVYLCVIFDFQTKSCDTVIDRCHIFFSANTFQDNSCNFCKVIVGKLC